VKNSSKVARLNKMLPAQLRPTLDLLEQAMKEVHEDKLQPSKGTAIASLASALVKVLESGILEERLVKLEERLKEEIWP